MVLVGTCDGVEAGMGISFYGKNLKDGDVGRKKTVQFECQFLSFNFRFRSEVGVEVAGMHSGVCSPTAHDGGRLAQQSGESLLQCELHRGQVGLGLPAAVVGTVVGKMDKLSHGRFRFEWMEVQGQ